MTPLLLQQAQWVVGLVAALGLITIAVAATMTRALFVSTLLVAALGAVGCVTALALGAPQAALALALLAALAPIVLLGVLLLSSRAAKGGARWAWITAGAAAVLSTGIIVGAALAVSAPCSVIDTPPSGALWLAALLLAAGLGGFGLLAFGERGGLGAESEPHA